MKQPLFVLAFAVFTLAVFSVSFGQEQPAVKPQMPSQTQMDEMMKKWMDAATPGESHKILARLAGHWNAEVTSWMSGPGAPPAVNKGESDMTMILGGRYLQQTVKSDMMGMQMEGIGFTGYDNIKKKFVGAWMDNMGTVISTMEGTADPTGTVITMWGTMDEPTTGERDKPVKYVTRLLSNDKHTFEIHDVSYPEGATKVMEIVYTRNTR